MVERGSVATSAETPHVCEYPSPGFDSAAHRSTTERGAERSRGHRRGSWRKFRCTSKSPRLGYVRYALFARRTMLAAALSPLDDGDLVEERAGHDDSLNLVSAFVDLGDLRIAHHPLDGEVARVTRAA